MTRFQIFALSLGLVLLAGVLGVRLAGAGAPPALHGTLLEPPLPAQDFTLWSGKGEALRASDYRGRLVVLFFGYTHCPDVCPLTLHRLAGAMERLGERAEQIQVILVSVDPERDRPEQVDEYAARFHPSFRGVSGSEEELRAVATRYGIFFAKSPGSEGTGYVVDHSASTLVLDRDGRVRMIFPYDVGSDELAADLRYLLRR